MPCRVPGSNPGGPTRQDHRDESHRRIRILCFMDQASETTMAPGPFGVLPESFHFSFKEPSEFTHVERVARLIAGASKTALDNTTECVVALPGSVGE